MKRFTIMVLVMLAAMSGWAQSFNYNKITPDLLEEINASTKSDELFQTIIIMDEQFDAQKSTRQMQYLNKAQQREFVVDELQRISANGQQEILKDLQAGQKSALVDDIHSFWIVNGISCSMTKDMIKGIAARPDVKFVMKNAEFHISDGAESEPIVVEKDSDPNQWNVTQVHADEVWSLGYTGQGVIVAVIDSGVNYNHTDIADNMWDGGTDYPHHGWDFVNDDNDPMDDNSHGTHCAGTVSSYGTNGSQCGIAKDAKIMALKVLAADGKGNAARTWLGIEFAVSHGADVLSLSLGSQGTGGYWSDRAIMENVLSCGVVASVAAGNAGDIYEDGQIKYPAPYNIDSPGNCPSPWHHPDQTLYGGHTAVVCVGATTSNDTQCSFSSFGPVSWTVGDHIGSYYQDYPWEENSPTLTGLIKPDISAPGGGIISLQHTNNTGYCSKSGTSMATPCVAGVMALMLSANPTLTPVEIDSIIETTAIACAGQTTKNNTFGAGRIDAWAAINYMRNVCAAPTGLNVSVNGFDVTLNWAPAKNINSYRVYRNGVMIANPVWETTYTDMNAPAGNNTYFVRSNGTDYQASLPSNQVTATVAATLTPNNLAIKSINAESNTFELQWNQLYYTSNGTYYFNVGEEHIAAQKFPATLLQSYTGMQIEHIWFSLANTGTTCTVSLYEGDDMKPGSLVHNSGTIATTEDHQLVDYVLETPLAVNPNKALWLTVTTAGALLIDTDYDSSTCYDGFWLSSSSESHWFWQPGFAWSFQMGLGSGSNYTYSLYKNGTAIASNILTTNTTTILDNGLNRYQVTANSNDYQSSFSNPVVLVNGNVSSTNLSLGANDKMTITEGSVLTLSGVLINTNPANLILEDGAQLIHNTTGVKATVKKNITSYNEDGGWNFIASPISETFTPTEENGLLSGNYDLYFYDEPFHTWRNHKEHLVDGINQNAASNFNIEYKKGYLYANDTYTTLQFAGTLMPSNNSITINDLSHSATELNGFNLVGNPFACNATVDRDFCVIDNTTNEVVLAQQNAVIAPCEGVFVQASEDIPNVTFSKANAAKDNNAIDCFDIVVTQGKANIDRARVRLGEGNGMEKFSLDDKHSQISLWQDGQDFAVAYVNGATEMPVTFSASKDGTYTLTIEASNLDLDYLHLIDNLTGNDVDLLVAPNYTFEAKTTDYTSRFKLMFVSACEDTDSNNENFAFFNDGNIIIRQEGTLQIVDMTGRVVVSHSGGIQSVSTAGMASGVYVLRLITADYVKTQKIVIE